jgi:hypothetical protein
VVQVRLKAEYECHPVWFPEEFENVPTGSLGVSRCLVSAINEWSETYEATYRPNDPISSGFQDEASERAFAEAGAALVARLQEELGEAYTVMYFNMLSSADEPAVQ